MKLWRKIRTPLVVAAFWGLVSTLAVLILLCVIKFADWMMEYSHIVVSVFNSINKYAHIAALLVMGLIGLLLWSVSKSDM